VLKVGDSVFVSIPTGLGGAFLPPAMNIIRDLALVPYVYQGMETPPPGKTSNIYSEARADASNCQAICVVLPPASCGQPERDWAIELVGIAAEQQIPLIVYGVTGASGQGLVSLPLPNGIGVRGVADALEFAAALREDLHERRA